MWTISLVGATVCRWVHARSAGGRSSNRLAWPCGPRRSSIDLGAAGSFDPGETTKTVELAVTGDRRREPPELVVILISDPSNATVGGIRGLGIGLIVAVATHRWCALGEGPRAHGGLHEPVLLGSTPPRAVQAMTRAWRRRERRPEWE